MRSLWIVVVLLFVVPPATTQSQFFPANGFSDDAWSDQFLTDWYSRELKILDEPSLLQMTRHPEVQSYRFLWLRTFHHPVAVRLDLRRDGIGVLTTKVASGAAGFPQKNALLIENVSRPLSQEQTQSFLRQVEKLGFWSLPRYVDRHGEDGAEWIIEGVNEGRYRVVSRWSPEDGEVRKLGLMLAIGLADMKIAKDEIY